MTYTVHYCCGNCGHEFTKEIEVGQVATSQTTCPRCKVYSAPKTWAQGR